MQTYIAILRGINVGGKNKMPMAELKTLLNSLELQEVQTYIQSGNVVFQSEDTDTSALASKISSAIHKHWGFNVPVLVLKDGDLGDILESNPFHSIPDHSLVLITFLAKTPDKELIDKLSGFKDLPNEYYITDKAIFLYCPNGYSKTKLSNTFFEKKLKVTATTRNLKTSRVLLQMCH